MCFCKFYGASPDYPGDDYAYGALDRSGQSISTGLFSIEGGP